MSHALQCICGAPGCTMPAARVRLPTSYCDEESNWASLCSWHEEEAREYWAERWADYYSDVYPCYPYR